MRESCFSCGWKEGGIFNLLNEMSTFSRIANALLDLTSKQKSTGGEVEGDCKDWTDALAGRGAHDLRAGVWRLRGGVGR